METRITQRAPDSENLQALSDLPPLLRRIYAARQVTCMADLERSLKGLLPFEGLLDIDKAVTRLAKAIAVNQRILIIGDFDADGDIDILCSSSAVGWYKNMGNDVFELQKISSSPAKDISSVDMDLDGDLDVVAAHLSNSDKTG